MSARYLVVDVFAREPLAGNALAVFPDPGSVDPALMQKIAREMNLSETTFVTGLHDDGYDVRIFTPASELPFAGHPTLGTAWTLRHLGTVRGDRMIQRSPAGETPVTFEGERVWLERTGEAGGDLADPRAILDALGIDAAGVGFDAAAIGGRPALLRPALQDAGGLPPVILPMSSPDAVAALIAPSTLPPEIDGVYCVAPLGPGRVKARFFAPGVGVTEDPATGLAATALGLYLGRRIGEIALEIVQGVEIARASLISLEAAPGRARVGGEVHLASEAMLVV